MELTFGADVLQQIDDRVWEIRMEERFLNLLGKPRNQAFHLNVIGAGPSLRAMEAEKVTFEASDSCLLNKGYGQRVVLVALADRHALNAAPEKSADREDSHRDFAYGEGDPAFLSSCREHGLPPNMVDLASDLLKSVREFADDQLREGRARKWVTYPRNFMAITIQNRLKQFVLNVKTPIEQFADLSALDVRDDGDRYRRFWLRSADQLSDAVTAIRRSVDL